MAEDMGTWSYTYASNGNLISQTDAKGQTINFSYDSLNRLTGKTYSTGIAAVTHIPLGSVPETKSSGSRGGASAS